MEQKNDPSIRINLRLLTILVLAYYVWISTLGANKFELSNKTHGDYISYNHLADALLAEKVNIIFIGEWYQL